VSMNIDRYRRQTLVQQLGNKGQELLATKHVVIIGAGGLGSNSANLLLRMGIGSMDIIDYDQVDLTNLHRTAVFSEEDIGKSKASVLQERLQQVNSEVRIKGITQTVTSKNIQSLVEHAHMIIDGTDSISLRLLINDTSIENNIPWVYAGVHETVGMVLGILPKKTPCFQCIAQKIPEPKNQEIPVMGSLPATIAAIQSNEAIKILLGEQPAGLLIYDVWNQRFDVMDIEKNPFCPACGKNESV
jgi:molybdopterin/thiamine biosynthesis adenylyltransferase